MKITVRVNEFKRVLEEALPVIAKRPRLEVLGYVRIDVAGTGQATLTASDLGSTIVQTFEIVEGDAGSLLLHARKTAQLLHSLTGGTATIEILPLVQSIAFEDGKVVPLGMFYTHPIITAGRFAARVPSIPAHEFPDVVKPMPEAAHTVSLKFLRQLLPLVAPAAPNKEGKSVIPAVQVEGTPERLRVVGTDGFRIAVADQKISGGTNFTLLIPKQVVPLIVRRAGGTVRFAENETYIFLQTDGVLLYFRKSAGSFPAYQKAVAVEAKTTLDVSTAELRSVVERMLVVADQNNPHMQLNFADGFLSASTSSHDSEAEVRIEVANATGIENKAKLNPGFVQEFLANAGDRTTISFVSERHLVAFASGNFRYYIMPMEPTADTEAVRAKLEAENKGGP
jgi:DNA polymerase III subunit beta